MQASRSTRFEPISFVASGTSNYAFKNASLIDSQPALRSTLRPTLRPTLNQPTIAGDVFAVVIWAAIVPGFMWLGMVMGM